MLRREPTPSRNTSETERASVGVRAHVGAKPSEAQAVTSQAGNAHRRRRRTTSEVRRCSDAHISTLLCSYYALLRRSCAHRHTRKPSWSALNSRRRKHPRQTLPSKKDGGHVGGRRFSRRCSERTHMRLRPSLRGFSDGLRPCRLSARRMVRRAQTFSEVAPRCGWSGGSRGGIRRWLRTRGTGLTLPSEVRFFTSMSR